MVETAHSIDGSVYCGFATDEAQKIDGANTDSFCIPCIPTVITLPVGRSLQIVKGGIQVAGVSV